MFVLLFRWPKENLSIYRSIVYFIVKISCRLLLLTGRPESARSIIHRLSLTRIEWSARSLFIKTFEWMNRRINFQNSFALFLLECLAFPNGSKEDSLRLRVSWKFLGLFDRRAWLLERIVRLGVTVTLLVRDEEGIFDEASRSYRSMSIEAEWFHGN